MMTISIIMTTSSFSISYDYYSIAMNISFLNHANTCQRMELHDPVNANATDGVPGQQIVLLYLGKSDNSRWLALPIFPFIMP